MGNICANQQQRQSVKYRRTNIPQYKQVQSEQIQQIKEFLTLTQQNTQSFQIVYKQSKMKGPPKTINDFSLIRVLGKGAFGKVLLAEDIKQKKYYAMKIIQKQNIRTSQQKIHTLSQRYILQSMENPFIVKLHFAFQNTKKLYLLVDFMAGGQLFYLLRRSKTFTEQITKFYAAQILLALEYLHFRNIIYRDLKPQNILLDQKGHIKLVDFGLSKVCYNQNQIAYSMCGTPQYIAPQMLSGKGYNQSADWFCFGSVIYDMLTGKPPFYSRNKNEIMKNIVSKQVPIPQHLSSDAKSLLKGLFQINPKKRLGYQNDATDIKTHPFFKKIDFNLLMKKKVKAPFNFEDDININGFDINLGKGPILETLHDDHEKGIQQNNFDGFTYQKSNLSPVTLLNKLESSKNFVMDFEVDSNPDEN